jgi:2-keto-4-pentenoate hydratase/2-oxohepta-3-ene-1,7-dioic acid hydratase in catechol pathway
MKLVTFQQGGKTRAGVLEEKRILPLDGLGFPDVLSFIAGGEGSESRVRFAMGTSDAPWMDAGQVQLLAPLLNPPRIFGIGLNYLEHAAESKMQVQAVPTVFLKLPSSITGPDTTVPLPDNATQPDYEAELAVVIGEPGHRIAAADWEQHVFGYTIVNDVSARGVQLATSQWTLGKSFPGFTPMGPAIVTRDEVGDPHKLEIQLTLSGEVMQHANTRDLIFRIPQLIEHISGIVPLQSGDVISTGTPPGVGLGRTPQRWLKVGEEMAITIEKIGTLRNYTGPAET